MDYGTLRNVAWTAKQVELSRRRDNLTFSHHIEIAKFGPVEQEEWLDWLEDQQQAAEPVSREGLRKAIKKAKRDGVVPWVEPAPIAVILPPAATLVDGDFREALSTLEPASVDLILTDPPYGREAVALYDDLGAFAARVLKPGGSLVAMAGQSYLPEVFALLGQHLRYHWTLAYLTPGGQSAQLWQRNVNTF